MTAKWLNRNIKPCIHDLGRLGPVTEDREYRTLKD